MDHHDITNWKVQEINYKDLMQKARLVKQYFKEAQINHGNNHSTQNKETYMDIALRLGVSVATMYRLLSLNSLIPDLQKAIECGDLSFIGAVKIAGKRLNEDRQRIVLQSIIKYKNEHKRNPSTKVIEQIILDADEVFLNELEEIKGLIIKAQEKINKIEFDLYKDKKFLKKYKDVYKSIKELKKSADENMIV